MPTTQSVCSCRAKVALARKLGIILHRMWIDGTTYRWAEASRSQRRLDQGIGDASGPNRGPTARSPVAMMAKCLFRPFARKVLLPFKEPPGSNVAQQPE